VIRRQTEGGISVRASRAANTAGITPGCSVHVRITHPGGEVSQSLRRSFRSSKRGIRAAATCPFRLTGAPRPRRRRRMRARQDAPEQKHHSKEQGHRSETLQAGSVVCMPRAGIQASHFIWRGPDLCGYRGRVKQKAAVNGPFPLCGVDMACDGGGGGVWWKCLGPCPGPVPLLPSDGTAARRPRASSRCGTHSIHIRRGGGCRADDQKSLELPTCSLAGWLSHRPALTNGTTMAKGGQNPSFGYDEGDDGGKRVGQAIEVWAKGRN